MSCNVAYETDIEDLLLSPESDACREFLGHCQGCESCARELGMVESTLLLLKGESPLEARQWHPEDEELLGLRSGALEPALAARVETHLEACPPCHDAYAAFGQLAGAPAGAAEKAAASGLIERVREAAAAFIDGLAPLLSPVPIASALVALLAVGILIQSGPVSQPEPQPGEIVVRGGEPPEPTPGETYAAEGVELTLLAGEEVGIAADSIEGSSVLLRLVAPGEVLSGAARISAADGRSLTLAPLPEEGGRIQLRVAAGWLDVGRYEVELEGHPGQRFILEVR